MDALAYPAVPGLFTACLFSGALRLVLIRVYNHVLCALRG